MNWPEIAYNTVIHSGLPLAVAGSYFSFKGRSPEKHTSMKFSVPSNDNLRDETRLWIHGASVGESSLANLILDWTGELGLNSDEVLITTQTLSGLDNLDHSRKALLPADYPTLIGPFANMIDADLLVVLETEIWPNLFRLHPGKLAIFNGRISDSSFGSYLGLSSLIRSTLSYTDEILARSERDQERLTKLIPENTSLRLAGNLKWTRCLDPPKDSAIPRFDSDAPVFVVGSTHPGEEEFLLEVLEEFEANVVLAPRHLDRLDEVRLLLSKTRYDWEMSSSIDRNVPLDDGIDLLLLDEFGLLESSFNGADLAFIGGSWKTEGGHNVLEAAQYGTPVVTGPNLQNFRESEELLKETGMLQVVDDRKSLKEVVRNWKSIFKSASASDSNESLADKLKPIKKTYLDSLNSLLK